MKNLIILIIFGLITNNTFVFAQNKLDIDKVGNFIVENIRDSLNKFDNINNVYFIQFEISNNGYLLNCKVNSDKQEVDIDKYPSMQLPDMKKIVIGLKNSSKIEKIIRAALNNIHHKINSKYPLKSIYILPIFIMITSGGIESVYNNSMNAISNIFEGNQFSNAVFLTPVKFSIVQ